MAVAIQTQSACSIHSVDYATFHAAGILFGIDIRQVREINRQIDATPVPHVSEFVRGVLNLRGEVVTVVDLRTILGMGRTEITDKTRNVIVNYQGEQIGILVDCIADVVTVDADAIEPLPANFHRFEEGGFMGVYKLDSQLLVVLDVQEVLGDRDIEHKTVQLGDDGEGI